MERKKNTTDYDEPIKTVMAWVGGWKVGGPGDGKDDTRWQPDELAWHFWMCGSRVIRIFPFLEEKPDSSRSESLMSHFESYL